MFVFTCATIEEDAVTKVADRAATWLFVLPLITEATDDVAVSRSVTITSEPEVSPAPVSVRVPFVHTSAASVPNPVRSRLEYAHTFAGTFARIDPIDVDAVFVTVFTALAIEVVAVLSHTAVAIVAASLVDVLTINVSSDFKRSTLTVPHDICAGYTPFVVEPANV